jgi:hypothetical protein
MNMQWKLAVGAAAVAASFGAQAGIVDLFTTEQLVPKDFTNGTITEADSEYNQAGAVADATILGGFRDLWVTNLSGGITNVAGSSINVTAGNLFFSTDSSATGVGEIQWDGDDSATGVNPIYDINPTGLGGIDLTQGGTLNAFELITIFSDLNWVFEITMYTDATNWTKVSLDATQVSSPSTSFIPFSAFTNDALCGTYGAAPGVNAITCSGTGADATDLGALVARLNTGDPGVSNPTIAIDLQLDSIRTVPEPGVLALMGMGLMAAGLASRRRKPQA